MLRRALPALGLSLAAACSGGSSPPPADAGPQTSPPYDRTWLISTHNSYWVDRGVPGDLFASGTGERLLDQLLVDHARGVEIDVHPDPASPGAFLVYHTTPGNGLCGTLPGCLAALRAFHRALPMHEALHVTLELKGITEPTFDASHTIADLDRILGDELGALLYRPSDLLDRCPGTAALGDCAKVAGWPPIHELRGRFLVSVLGNWDGLPGAQATLDYVDYATHGSIRDRAAFPMASAWQLDREALSGPIYGMVTQKELDHAYAQSVFLQIEDPADTHVSAFLARRGVIRVDSSFSVGDQTARAALGMQLLQTDTPWIQADDHGPSQPLRDLAGTWDAGVMREPGSRLTLGPGAAGERVFAYATAAATSTTTWETAVSSGLDASRVGCLRAASALGSDEGSVTVCRTKIAAIHDADAGAASPDAERVIVKVTTCQAGVCDEKSYPSTDPAGGGPGDLLRLEVDNQAGGSSCVKVSSAAEAGRDLSPTWQALGDPRCFAAPLGFQGIATPAAASLFGTRRGSDPIGAAALTVVAEGAGDAGAFRTDATLLTDDSSP